MHRVSLAWLVAGQARRPANETGTGVIVTGVRTSLRLYLMYVRRTWKYIQLHKRAKVSPNLKLDEQDSCDLNLKGKGSACCVFS